jgi:flagellin
MALSLSYSSIANILNSSYQASINSVSESLERLSTGLRINSASDDPAGFTVSDYLRGESAALNQAKSNATDALSLLQTADGSLDVISEKLIRMKELAEQASTATYTQSQRLILQSEFEIMAAEIDRIASNTEFNGIKLLNGNLSSSALRQTASGWNEPAGGLEIQVGTGNDTDDSYFINIDNVSTSELFSGSSVAISTQELASSALNLINTAIINKNNTQSWVGALENRLEGTIDNLTAQYEALNNAEETISDVDIASEMANYVSEMVTVQAATAMYAQANIFPGLVIDLLESL